MKTRRHFPWIHRSGVRRRLFLGFALQAGAISLAVLLGVGGASLVLRDVLINRALIQEAGHYAQRLSDDPHAGAPDTVNLTGYFRRGPADSVPDYLLPLEAGFHHLGSPLEGHLAYVEKHADGTLYLVFREANVMKLAWFFGIVPLAGVLLIVYLVTWWTYRMSHRAVSPLVRLARQVESLDLNRLDGEIFDAKFLASAHDEVFVLTNALEQLNHRIQRFVERERNFTRDASHELRSPLTVIQMAADVLAEESDLGDYERRTVHRIRTASRDMQALIEALLVLARESGEGLTEVEIAVNELVQEEVHRYGFLVRNKRVRLIQTDLVWISVHGPRSVLSVMVGNLIRNACAYTDEGDVKVTVGKGYVSVDDTGVGMSGVDVANAFKPFYRGRREGRGGHGVGLTIVKRLSDRFHWPVDIKSELGVGTCATIYFPNYEFLRRQEAS